MTLRKRLVFIGIATVILPVVILIAPGQWQAEGPDPQSFALSGASLHLVVHDLDALRTTAHTRGLAALLESLAAPLGSPHPLVADSGSLDPRRPAFWMSGALSLSLIKAPDESELPITERSPDPRAPWPFSAACIAWRPEGAWRRGTLAWASQPWFWRSFLASERGRAAGARFDSRGLILEHPAALLPPDLQSSRRRLPRARLERIGQTLVLTLADFETTTTTPPPSLLDEGAAFAAELQPPWNQELGQALRGLAHDHVGSVLATWLAPNDDAAISLTAPLEGEVALSLDFASDVRLAPLPRPADLGPGDLATVVSATSGLTWAQAALSAPASRPDARRTQDADEAERAVQTTQEIFLPALEDLVSKERPASPDRAPLAVRLQERESGLTSGAPAFALVVHPSPGPASLADALRRVQSAMNAGAVSLETDGDSGCVHVRSSSLPAAIKASSPPSPSSATLRAALRARVNLVAWQRYALRGTASEIAPHVYPPAHELLALEDSLRRDLAYALGEEDQDLSASPTFKRLLAQRLATRLRIEADARTQASRARLERLARLDLGSLRYAELDLIEVDAAAKAPRRRLQVTLR